MPISGVVITGRQAEKAEVLQALAVFPEVEVYGDDDKGNIVAVLETGSSEEMEKLIDRIGKNRHVLHVGLTYLNTEDESDRPANGELPARPFGFRRPVASDR
jgi:nitrate reductase NapAB chaperone NapD